jgi:hypothetical protein
MVSTSCSTGPRFVSGCSGSWRLIDLPDGEAEVDFDDDRVSAAQVIGAVQHAGYDAKLAG